MKNLMYYILLICLFYWSCKPKEDSGPDTGFDAHPNNSHLLRVYPGLSESLTVNPIEQISPLFFTYLKNSDFPVLYAPRGCFKSNTNYQIFKIKSTQRESLKWLEDRTVFVSSSSTPINNLIRKPGSDPYNPIYYESVPLGDGRAGCQYGFICINNKLDSFHYNNQQYIHLSMAYHNRLNDITHSIDTLENYEFSISNADYDALNSLTKTYPVLRCGVDSMNHNYIKVFKDKDTIPSLTIFQVFK